MINSGEVKVDSEHKRPNALSQCIACWRRNSKGVPPMLWTSLLTGALCWIFGAVNVILLLLGAVIVLLLLRRIESNKEE